MKTTVSPKRMTEREIEQVERANATTATPVVFVHGLWLLPSSWGGLGTGQVRCETDHASYPR
jgi:hypothetical protein